MTMVILLGLAGPAEAVDLAELRLAWTNTIDGQHGFDGQDEAAAVEIDENENLVAVGWLDGAVDHGTDGYAVAWNPDGTIRWEITEDVGVIGVDRTSSSDALHDVWMDEATEDLAMCGRRGAATLTDPEGRYLIERRTESLLGAPPVLDWEFFYIYGPPDAATVQECFGLDWGEFGNIATAGWGLHGVDFQGAWLGLRVTDVEAVTINKVWTYNDQPYLAAPDQAYAIATNALSGDVVIVGQRGFSGLDGSLLNDTDWYVRAYDSAGLLLWEDTFAGEKFLEDRATDVIVDLNSQDIYVVGYTNVGSDNGADADFDWRIVRYNDEGDGFGGPSIEWVRTWESVPGASEGALSVTLDENDEPLVGGWAMDASGQEVWRLAKLTGYDGSDGQSWQDIPHGGNSRLTDVVFLDSDPAKLLMGGYIDVGAGRDFAAILLEGDTDGDGTPDSVDACPDDPLKAEDEGLCGCDIPDDDTDGDGVVNCEDGCPSDPEKTEPGVCSCDFPDADTDGDGTEDCIDNCPSDPNKIDAGECGCGAPDTDSDGDGVLGCRDACSNTPPDVEVDPTNGCPIEEEPGDTDDEATDSGSDTGCGCASTRLGGVPGGLALLVAAGMTLRSRRHRTRMVRAD